MGYCMPIMNFNMMRPMPFFGCNCMPQFPMMMPLFSMMFNPMQFAMPSFNSNPWAMMGWQPSYSMPVNNFSMFNQPANLFSAQPVNYFNNCNFTTVLGNRNTTRVNSDNNTAKPAATTATDDGAPLNLSDAELTAYGFDTPEKRTGFRQLKPKMQRAVVELTNYAKSQGIKITYASKRSIFRTRAEQEAIYRTARPGYAAKPGHSRHESGEAVDITIPGANKNSKNDPQYRKLAEKWQSMGYTWGGNWNACEPWHFDLRPKKGC